MPEYILATTEQDYKIAAELFTEYADWLKIDLCFQNFNEELKQLKNMYAPNKGGIVLCKIDDEFIGCSAIRKIDDEICELKRMWVNPGFQQKGIGEKLLQECIKIANQLHYKLIRLDTLQRLEPAIKLYIKYGFVITTPYYKNPNADVVYMQKEL